MLCVDFEDTHKNSISKNLAFNQRHPYFVPETIAYMSSKNTIKEKVDALVKRASIASAVYLPEKLSLSDENQFIRFSNLLNQAGITVHDQIEQQLKEFIKLSHPSRHLSACEVDTLLQAHIGSTPLWQYGCWFYYPWSNRLVHLLDEYEFVSVRTSRNQYKITPEEHEILKGKKIGIVGLSVGQSVSVTLAMERICGELRLADFDLLELTNLNRIRTGTQNLGILKAHSVAREIAELDPYLKVVCYIEGLHEENMDDFFTKDGKLDLLVEESDGFDIKVLARYKARELQVPVIMEASDRCMVDVERFDLEPNRPILHGILDHLDIASLKSLKTNEEKIPYMFDILGLKSTSAKLKASMLEMQQTITTWPQLASAVTMGGGITADVSRRILLNDFKSSGRYYVDIDELIGDKPEAFCSVDKMALTLSASTIEDEDLKVQRSDVSTSELEQIISAMMLAPTFGNQQSWQFALEKQNIVLYYPENNPLSNTDCDNIQLNISIGAVIEHAKQKAAELGFDTIEKISRIAKFAKPVAVLSFTKATKKIENLASVLTKRKTNRSFGSSAGLKPEELQFFSKIPNDQTVNVHIISDRSDIESLAANFAIAERINLLHPDRHKDFFGKVFKDETSSDCVGINVRNFSMPNAMKVAYSVLESPQVAKCLSTWKKGTAFENYHKALIASSDALMVVTTDIQTLSNCIAAGEIVVEFWLNATKNNLGFHPICVSLTLLQQMKTSGRQSKSFSDTTLAALKQVELGIRSCIGITENSTILFAARIFKSTTELPDSKRKSVHEFIFNSQHSAV